MKTNPMTETSSFTKNDEKWFTSPPRPSKRPAPPAPIDDPVADRWFR